jgi:hypothetical protein
MGYGFSKMIISNPTREYYMHAKARYMGSGGAGKCSDGKDERMKQNCIFNYKLSFIPGDVTPPYFS